MSKTAAYKSLSDFSSFYPTSTATLRTIFIRSSLIHGYEIKTIENGRACVRIIWDGHEDIQCWVPSVEIEQ